MKMTKEEQDAYWKNAMDNRQPISDEVSRLISILLGHHYRHMLMDEGKQDYLSLEEFVHSKRPYGNKDIAQSIAFNLGWDSKRILMTHDLDNQAVREAAEELHSYVVGQINDLYGFFRSSSKFAHLVF